MSITSSIRSFALPFLRAYWRIFKPYTYGVKVLIIHPEFKEKILVVSHSYGDQKLWNIPGGGFNPKKETDVDAAVREAHEEIGIRLISPRRIGTYETTGEGKRDTVYLFSGTFDSTEKIRLNSEIKEMEWIYAVDSVERADLARVARRAIKHHYGL